MNSELSSKSRRNFLSRILSVWSTLITLPFVYVVAEFVYPPLRKEKMIESLAVAKLGEIPANSAKIVKFNKKPIIIVHTQKDQFKAFSAVCTHLGCIVEYRPDQDGHFHCNCHGSKFDLQGKNLEGPAPTPLQPVRISLKDSDIILSVPSS